MTDQATLKVDYETGEESLIIEARLDPHEPFLQPVVRSSTGSRQSRSLMEAMEHARCYRSALQKPLLISIILMVCTLLLIDGLLR